MKPLIFITNDDSISAPGLHHLIKIASRLGQVIAVAPQLPQSGQSSAITVDAPLRINEVRGDGDARIFTVSGTPVDCVKLGLHAITPRKPDLILSGINHGSNSGNAILYSGTMGAVLEGCTVGIPSVGFSLCNHSLNADFSMALPFIDAITRNVLEYGLPPQTALNVNIPGRTAPRGVRVCRAAQGHWSEQYERMMDPHGKPFYWLTGRFVNEEKEAVDTDEYWLAQSYISVVPVMPDQTAFSKISEFSSRFDSQAGI